MHDEQMKRRQMELTSNFNFPRALFFLLYRIAGGSHLFKMSDHQITQQKRRFPSLSQATWKSYEVSRGRLRPSELLWVRTPRFAHENCHGTFENGARRWMFWTDESINRLGTTGKARYATNNVWRVMRESEWGEFKTAWLKTQDNMVRKAA